MGTKPISDATVAPPRLRHQGPPLGMVALVYTVLFVAGVWAVTAFGGQHFPTPWEPAATIAAFFRARPEAVRLCAFLQFGAAITLGIFTACAVNQLRFLGVRAAGANIALVGGVLTVANMVGATMLMWAMAQPGIAQDATLTCALYYASFALGGPGFSAPFGLLMAGVSIPALFLRLLPRWLGWMGVALGACGVLSSLSLVAPQTLFLIPLTRFSGFAWMVAAGFALPRTVAVTQRGAMA